jgi:hypothetical protein
MSLGDRLKRIGAMLRDKMLVIGVSIVAVGVIWFLPQQRFSAAIALGVAVIWAAILAALTAGNSRNALVLVAAILVVPTIVEAVLVIRADPPSPQARYTGGFGGARSPLGYAPWPSSIVQARRVDIEGRTIFDVTYTFDEHSLRRTRSNPNGPTVAFFFDSMVFGEGVSDGDTLPQIFADLTGTRFHVVNFGITGYGPQAMLRTFETGFRDELLVPRPIVFVVHTAAWHAERVACRPPYSWNTPRYAVVAGAVAYQGECADRAERRVLFALNSSYLYRELIRPWLVTPQRDLDLYLAVLREAVALGARKYGGRTIVLYKRSDAAQFVDTTYTDETIMASIRESGAVVIDTAVADAGETGLEIPDDGHPTPKANRVHAALLWDAMRKNEVFGESGQ